MIEDATRNPSSIDRMVPVWACREVLLRRERRARGHASWIGQLNQATRDLCDEVAPDHGHVARGRALDLVRRMMIDTIEQIAAGNPTLLAELDRRFTEVHERELVRQNHQRGIHRR